MTGKENRFYLVRADILPEAMYKTAQANQMLENGEVQTAQEAAQKVNISRSAYYKYREAILPFNKVMRQQIMTVSVMLEHQAGALSGMLTYIASQKGNVLTINQTIPLQGLANVVISIETAHMDTSAEHFADDLEQLASVRKVTIVGQG